MVTNGPKKVTKTLNFGALGHYFLKVITKDLVGLDPIKPQSSYCFTITGVCYFWPSLCSDSETVTTEVPDYYDYEEYDYDNDNAV